MRFRRLSDSYMCNGFVIGIVDLFYECQRLAFSLSAPRSSDTMHIIVVGRGQVKVNHVRDVINIKPPRGNVGRDEHLCVSGLEKVEGLLTFRKILVAMDGFRLEAALCEHL